MLRTRPVHEIFLIVLAFVGVTRTPDDIAWRVPTRSMPVTSATEPFVRFHSFTHPPRFEPIATRDPETATAVARLPPRFIEGTDSSVRAPDDPIE